MAGNHYSRSVAALEQTLELKMQQLSILQEHNHVLRKREAALLAAASSISGGLEATKSVLCSSTHTAGGTGCDTGGSFNSGTASQQPVAQSSASYSCGGILDTHACLAKLEEKEAEVQQVLHSMGCTEPYWDLYSTQLLRRAVQSPDRVAVHLGRTLTQRLQYITHVVQRFGVLLPKYDIPGRIATSLGSAQQQLEELVDDLSERVLICGLLDQPSQHMQENMINLETGLSEQYPPGHWEFMIQAMQLTGDQKAALKVCWERLKPLSKSITGQHEKLAARLAELQKQQHQRQKNFEQQAQTVYAGHNENALLERHARLQQQQLEERLHRELIAAAELSVQSDAHQQQQQQLPQLPSIDQQWQQQFEKQMEADLLEQLNLKQQQQQVLPINQDLSYAPVSAADIDAAALAIVYGDIWQPAAVSNQQQQQQRYANQPCQRQQEQVCRAMPNASVAPPFGTASRSIARASIGVVTPSSSSVEQLQQQAFAAQRAVSVPDGWYTGRDGSRTAAAAAAAGGASYSSMLRLQQAGALPLCTITGQCPAGSTATSVTAAAMSRHDSSLQSGTRSMAQQRQQATAMPCKKVTGSPSLEDDVNAEQPRSWSCSSATSANQLAAAAALPSRLAATRPGSVTTSAPSMDASYTHSHSCSGSLAAAAKAGAASALGLPNSADGGIQSKANPSSAWPNAVSTLMYDPLLQQQLPQQQQQRIAASDVVLMDDQEPVATVHSMLARCTTAGQSDILVQLCNKDQQQIEHDLDKVTAQLKMLHHCMVLHIHNTLTKKQIALAYLNCYPFVPEAFSFCEALDDMGW